MDCIGCANSIKSYLSKLGGVKKVDLNFTSEVASIDFDPKEISEAEIKSNIRKLGYDVAEDEDEAKAELERNKKLFSQRIKILASIVLSLGVMFISMQMHSQMFGDFEIPENFSLVQLFIMTSIVVFWCGAKFIKGAYNALRSGTSDMNTLISLGTLSAYIYSVVVSANHLFNLGISALSNAHEVYYETAAMIVTFLLIGNYLEAVLKSKTQSSIKKLKGLQAKNVTVIRGGEEITIPFRKVRTNDIVIIRTGDKIPVDGKITEGYCVADESAMTGESLPVEKRPGDELISGTVLKNGFVKLKAERVGKETTLSKIISLVNEASNSKPKIQRLADKISAIFVPIVIAIAIATFLVWNFIAGAPFETSLLYAVSVLIIACPCALGLASPIAVVIGIGRAAENGILFNNVEAIEKLNKVDTICFDKTGTLTSGEMKVREIKPLNGVSKNELMQYVFSVEKFSNHPIARSIYNYALEHNVEPLEDVKDLSSDSGLGIRAVVNRKPVLIGSLNYIKENNIELSGGALEEGKGNLYISIEGVLCGIIEFEDRLKPEAREIVKNLRESGYGIHMISGDNEKTAREVAGEAGIENFSSKVMPAEKEKIVSRLQAEGKNVAMVGDGINDAPSLAKANVGIAVGTGQDIAIDSADVILVKGDLRSIPKAVKLSAKTVSIIKQNIFWAFFYNAMAIPAAAGVFAPLGFVISPVMAAMLMAFSDVVTVVGNSLRLKYFKID